MPLVDKLPRIDDRRFEDIVAEARTRIPRYTPEWTDLNDNDPGIALVQLFAWLSEMMLFRMNRVPELHYLKFLELLGIELLPAEPARAEVTFPLTATAPPTVAVPLRLQVSAESPDSPRPIVFETERALVALRAKLDAVQVFDGYGFTIVTQQNDDAAQPFDAFGPHALPESALMLGFDDPAAFPETELDLAFFVPQRAAPGGVSCHGLTGAAPAPATIAWEYWSGAEWRSLNVLRDETLALTRSGHIVLRTPIAGLMAKAALGEVTAARYWIRGRLERASYERRPELLAVRTNTAGAVQAETVRNEVLGGSDGSPNQSLKVSSTPVLSDTLVLEIDQGGGFEVWARVDGFFGSGPNDLHYTLNRTTGEVRFGDGRRGAIPVGNNQNPGGSIVAREYRHGGGARGNVAAGAIATMLVSIDGIDDAKVGNLLPAAGGRDEESLADAKLRAPRAIRSRGRAVTAEDFEALATQAANVRRAKALPLRHPDFPGVDVPGVVTVIVVPDGDAPDPLPSEATLRLVCSCLNRARLVTTELYVVPPKYRRVHVTAEVVAEDAADLAEIKSTIEATLLEYFHPLRGGEDRRGWPFGGDIFYSRVYQRVSVAGVQRIERLVIALDGVEAPECTNIRICDGELVYSTEHDVRVAYAFEA